VLAGDLFDFDRRHGDLQRHASEYGAFERRLDSDKDKLQRGGRCGEKNNGGGDMDLLIWYGIGFLCSLFAIRDLEGDDRVWGLLLGTSLGPLTPIVMFAAWLSD
jgi:hypothetical protein